MQADSLTQRLLPLWATYLLAELGWRKTRLVLAVVVVVLIMPLVWRVIRNTPQDHGIEPEAAAPGDAAGSALADARGLDTRTILGVSSSTRSDVGRILAGAVTPSDRRGETLRAADSVPSSDCSGRA